MRTILKTRNKLLG